MVDLALFRIRSFSLSTTVYTIFYAGAINVHVDLSHSAPTVPGSTVTIDLKLTEVDGRILTFDVEARDEYAVISEGTHRRGLVNREKFESRLADR